MPSEPVELRRRSSNGNRKTRGPWCCWWRRCLHWSMGHLGQGTPGRIPRQHRRTTRRSGPGRGGRRARTICALQTKCGAVGQEMSVFHGKSMMDYQDCTYMHPPLAEAPHLANAARSEETFIPKVCVHTWMGHTQGVSIIWLFPNTGHLLLSGSMDTKIKVCTALAAIYPSMLLMNTSLI